MPSPKVQLIAQAEQYGRRVAIVASEGVFTYSALQDSSRRTAGYLLNGDDDLNEARVAFMIRPGFRYVATQWGIWRAGGIAVPLCISHPPPELEYVIRDSDASVVVADQEFVPKLAPITNALGLRIVTSAELAEVSDAVLPQIGASRRGMILYTSGTTSRPKGVVSTHAGIQSQIVSLVSAWGWTSDDFILNTLPLHHTHGVINALACALWVGAKCELRPSFDVDEVWARLTAGSPTLFMGVPTMYKALVAAWQRASPEKRRQMSEGSSRLRLMVSGSDALPVETFEAWQAITGHDLLERYGMTEIGMALSNPLHGRRVPGCVGTPLPGVEVRLVDLDLDVVKESGEHRHGKPTEPGQPGEIQVRGPSVFREYWRNPDATASAFTDDGWFCTGDVASVDNGTYRIWGRASQDLMISGGENVSAKEVERVLGMHPDIVAHAVVGVPHPFWGEAVSAVLVLREGSDWGRLDPGSLRQAVREWAKERLADYKVPQNVISCEDLPRNAMGKLIKPEIARLFEPPP